MLRVRRRGNKTGRLSVDTSTTSSRYRPSPEGRYFVALIHQGCKITARSESRKVLRQRDRHHHRPHHGDGEMGKRYALSIQSTCARGMCTAGSCHRGRVIRGSHPGTEPKLHGIARQPGYRGITYSWISVQTAATKPIPTGSSAGHVAAYWKMTQLMAWRCRSHDRPEHPRSS